MEANRAGLLRLLEAELDFIEGGGYSARAGEPGAPRPMFYHSLACINHWLVPGHDAECHDDCILLDAVPDQHKGEALPCHFIRLNESGDTVRSLEEKGDREKLEQAVKQWLRSMIGRLKKGETPLGLRDVKY